MSLGNLTGTATNGPAAGATFSGTLSNIRFVNQNGVLSLVGNLTGTLTSATNTVLGSVTNLPINLPLTGAAATGP